MRFEAAPRGHPSLVQWWVGYSCRERASTRRVSGDVRLPRASEGWGRTLIFRWLASQTGRVPRRETDQAGRNRIPSVGAGSGEIQIANYGCSGLELRVFGRGFNSTASTIETWPARQGNQGVRAHAGPFGAFIERVFERSASAARSVERSGWLWNRAVNDETAGPHGRSQRSTPPTRRHRSRLPADPEGELWARLPTSRGPCGAAGNGLESGRGVEGRAGVPEGGGGERETCLPLPAFFTNAGTPYRSRCSVADEWTRCGHRTWVVIAAFNEGCRDRARRREVVADGWNVVVVDDGSRDDTRRARARARRDRRCATSINLGQGAALQTGIDYALRRGAAHDRHVRRRRPARGRGHPRRSSPRSPTPTSRSARASSASVEGATPAARGAPARGRRWCRTAWRHAAHRRALRPARASARPRRPRCASRRTGWRTRRELLRKIQASGLRVRRGAGHGPLHRALDSEGPERLPGDPDPVRLLLPRS